MKKYFWILTVASSLLAVSCGPRELYNPDGEDYSLKIFAPVTDGTNNFPVRIQGTAGKDVVSVVALGGTIPMVCTMDGVIFTVVYHLSEIGFGPRTLTFYARDAAGTTKSTLSFAFYFTNGAVLIDNPNIPAGDPWGWYYADCYGKTGAALKAAIHEAINDHVVFPYTASTTDVWDILKVVDEDPMNPDNVIGIYSRISIPKASQSTGGSRDWYHWEREHVWPNSRGFKDEYYWPPFTDVHLLHPEVDFVNGDKSDKDIAYAIQTYDDYVAGLTTRVACPYDFPDTLKIGANTWEPPDEVKGDVARILFYMDVRYEGDRSSPYEPDLQLVNYIPTISDQPFYAQLSNLLVWNANDPPDAAESNRNDLIYSNYQGNRNPFVDHPEWVNLIWTSTGYVQ